MASMAVIPAGATVWVKDTAKGSQLAFIKAEVVSFTEGRGYTVKTAAGEEAIVRPVNCSQANPEGMSAPDNCYLIHISESTILDNMKMRFADKKIYTYTANILIAVNPFQSMSIYGHEHMSPYVNKPLGLLEPHVYAMAEEAYKSMLKSKASQSLVVSGESGAGKTETNKHLMNYLTFRSKSETVGSDIGNVILQANPVLEAFGNAKTSRNNNSSRFGKFVKVSFGETGGILGASTQQYLLEKSRVPFQSKGERNYHVFYDVVAGYADPAALGLEQGTASFHYLNQSGVTRSAVSTTARAMPRCARRWATSGCPKRSRRRSACCSPRCCTSATCASTVRTRPPSRPSPSPASSGRRRCWARPASSSV